jgi:hypothetical protein
MRMSSRTCGHIPTSILQTMVKPNCGDDWCNKSHSHRKQIIPDTGMLLTSTMPSCFAMVRLRRPATKTNPGKTLASWQALAKTPTPPALCNTRLSEKILNARVAETSDYSHAAIYSTSITFMPSMWGLRQRRADFFKAHCRN